MFFRQPGNAHFILGTYIEAGETQTSRVTLRLRLQNPLMNERTQRTTSETFSGDSWGSHRTLPRFEILLTRCSDLGYFSSSCKSQPRSSSVRSKNHDRDHYLRDETRSRYHNCDCDLWNVTHLKNRNRNQGVKNPTASVNHNMIVMLVPILVVARPR